MSLINDMLNDLEQNKDKKNSNQKKESLNTPISPEGTPDLNPGSTSATPPSMPPAEKVSLQQDSATHEDKIEEHAVTLTPDNTTTKTGDDNPTKFRQPWESENSSASTQQKTAAPTHDHEAATIKANKPSQKRLIIWVIIIAIACAILGFIYFWPAASGSDASNYKPVATPSTTTPTPAPTPTVEIKKEQDNPVHSAKEQQTSDQADTAIAQTPADQSAPKNNAAMTGDSSSSINQASINHSVANATDTKASEQVSTADNVVVKPVTTSPEINAQNSYDTIMSKLSTSSSASMIKQLQNLITEYPSFNNGRLALAAMLIKYGKQDQALNVLQQGLAQEPGNAQFAELSAHVLVQQNKIAQALAILKAAQPAAIQSSPNYYALMAGLYLQEKNYQQAKDFYLALTNLNPHNGSWWAGLGISYNNLNLPQAAYDAFNRAETVGGLSPALAAYVDKAMQGS